MRRAAAGRVRPSHKLLYLFHLSDDDELTLSPVRAPLAGVIGEIAPVPLGLLDQETRPAYLTEEDFRILHELAERCELLPGLTWYPLPASAHALFRRVLATGRARWQAADGVALCEEQALSADVAWRQHADGSQSLCFELPDSAATDWRLLPLLPPWVVDPDSGGCREVQARSGHGLVLELLQRGPVDPDEVDEVRDRIRSCAVAVPEPEPIEIISIARQQPQPLLHLQNVAVGVGGRFETLPAVALAFRYGELVLDWDAELARRAGETVPGQRGRRVLEVQRDLGFEEACLNRLGRLGLVPLAGVSGLDYPPGDGGLLVPSQRDRLTQSWVLVQRGLERLAGKGWGLRRSPDLTRELLFPEAWECRVDDAQAGWIAIDVQIRCADERLSLIDAIARWVRQTHPMQVQALMDSPQQSSDHILEVDERRLVWIAPERLKAVLEVLIELTDLDQTHPCTPVKLRRARLADLAELVPHWVLSADPGLSGVARQLNQVSALAPAAEPEGLNATLREYQRLGLGWLQFLREAGFGGILADDMGLGKTVQTLAHVLSEKNAGRLDRPALVVAPTSLMFNWRAEAHRFAPDLKVLLLHGPRRRGDFQWIGESDLVLTTYPLLGRDIDWLGRERWHLVILDEAQAIKNPRTRASRAVRRLDTRHRLCLTGTPMENNLNELWSQFDFLMPGLLGSERQFRGQFRQPIEKLGNQERRSVLARRIRPFFLRRTKAEVAPELPAKTEIVRSVPLAGGQLRLYRELREELKDRVRRALRVQGPEQGRMVILDALLRLRQVCCDPRLLEVSIRGNVAESAKLELLMDLLPEMVVEGRRILLFSQFVRMLELIERELVRRGIGFLTLTGRTRDRQAVIEAFQKGRAPVFLISLRAGGVGLNLTAADTVIHYDPWWNPAVEDQATDRAHRIGQEQKVFVYRLLTDDTIEDRVQRLQASKRDLIDGLLGSGGAADLGVGELEMLLDSS